MLNAKNGDVFANDVWEMGFLILHLMLRDLPWSGGDHHIPMSIYNLDTREERAARIKRMFPIVSTPLSELLARVFCRQEKRITASEFATRLANNRHTFPMFSSTYKPSRGGGRGHHKRTESEADVYGGYACFNLQSNGTAAML
jgi:hypothetical protein